jgi:SAM-dependent methyltransferase
MLDKARRKAGELGLETQIDIRLSDIRDMAEFPDNHFAMVLCEGDPLSYCGDHRRATAEFARVVRPGGTVIASVDNRAAALNWLRDADPEAVRRLLEDGDVIPPQEHEEYRYTVHAFTPEELRELFESNGLSVQRIIGKLAVARRLACYASPDPAVQDWLFELELKYNHDPAFYPWAGHLEIAGRKRRR